MTQEEKDLLLKDLCARLPYGVQILSDLDKEFDDGMIATLSKIEPYNADRFSELNGQFLFYLEGCLTPFTAEEVRPYLRPLSSMTTEEKQLSRWYQHDAKNDDFILYMNQYVEWLDSKHFDWRTDGNRKTLIEKGLALEASEGMYKK